jgi:hypothetical protein
MCSKETERGHHDRKIVILHRIFCDCGLFAVVCSEVMSKGGRRHLFEQPHEHICGQSSLVRLIQYDATVSLQDGVVHCFSEEHTIRHKFQDRRLRSHVFETN